MQGKPLVKKEMKFIDWRLVREIKSSKNQFLGGIAASLMHGFLLVFQAYLLSLVISKIFIDHSGYAGIARLLWILIAVVVLRAIFTWMAESLTGKAAVQVKAQLRGMLQEHVYRLGVGYVRVQHSGELTTVITDGIEALDAYLSQYIPQLALAGVLPAAMILIVFPIDPISGLILLLTAPLIPIFMVLISEKTETVTKRHWNALRRMSIQFLDTLQGLVTLKILNQSKARKERISLASDRYRQTTLEVLKIAFLSALVLELVSTLSTALLAVGIGLRLLSGRIQFQQALFILLIAPEFYFPLRQLGIRFHAGISGVTASKRIFEIMEQEPIKETSIIEAGWENPGINSIRFESVQFSYPGQPQAIFSDLTFQILPGKLTALAGGSGSGKTTLFNLLLRFYYPDGGVIKVNEKDINRIPLETWMRQVSWVSQQPFIYNTTFLENIRIAKPDASREEIEQAMDIAHLRGVIDGLENGLKTRVGEGGMRISGGQAQCLGLARAFLKDAPILLMDEPTEMLDPAQEEVLHNAIEKLCVKRTVIVIAHRLKTLARADRILFMENGQIIESGTHQELVQKQARYFQMIANHL